MLSLRLQGYQKIRYSVFQDNISKSYEIKKIQLIAGKLSENIPVFIKESAGSLSLDIFVDVRHPEILKLKDLGFTPILYSLITTFCREYLGSSLKKWSPRFFGDGALNLELLAKRRSELWILLKDDIGVIRKGGQRQVVTRSDVQVVNISAGHNQTEVHSGKRFCRILNIVDDQKNTGLEGFYIRLPDTAFRAYGDLLSGCDSRGVVWAGNKIGYVVSDTVSAAFKYEIRLDEVVSANIDNISRAEGAIQIEQSLQEMFGGLYFPIQTILERFMVPDDQ